MTFTTEQRDRCRQFGDVTGNGVVFHWELSGPDGAHFFLIRESHHSDADMRAAKGYLRARRDVTGFTIARLQTDVSTQ